MLESWARWLCSNSGWNHRSPTDRLIDQVGIGRSGFVSTVPMGVEPGKVAHLASIAMQELRERDGRSVIILEAVYLRSGKAKLADVATRLGLTLPALTARRRRAEMAFYALVRIRPDEN